MGIRRYFFLFILLQQITLPSFSQSKRALIIGLGQQEDKNWSKINGDRDIPIVQNLLLTAGFHDFRILKNKKATKQNIINAFTNLVKDCKLGDIIYIHFSGHGQQMSDKNGDEIDGWDETWIPYDAYRTYCNKDKGNKHLTDDEICQMLKKLRTKIGSAGKMLVVIDACHSGTSTWNADTSTVTSRGVLDRFIIPNVNKAKHTDSSIPKNGWITISACKDFQSNFEMQNLRVGKLTYALKILVNNRRYYDNNEEIEKQLIKFMEDNPNPRQVKQTPVVTESKFKDLISEIIL